jgi:predicted nucleotidyltransferase
MKNSFGLLDRDMEAIAAVLSPEPRVEKAIIFGSRAKGNFRNGSDVDLALKGRKLDFSTISRISYQLNEETAMPYKFDVLNYHTLKEPALIEHIDRVGVEFYRRGNMVGSPYVAPPEKRN